MKALQMKFFSTVGSTPTTDSPKQIITGLHGWCIKEFLYPAMKEDNFLQKYLTAR